MRVNDVSPPPQRPLLGRSTDRSGSKSTHSGMAEFGCRFNWSTQHKLQIVLPVSRRLASFEVAR